MSSAKTRKTKTKLQLINQGRKGAGEKDTPMQAGHYKGKSDGTKDGL